MLRNPYCLLAEHLRWRGVRTQQHVQRSSQGGEGHFLPPLTLRGDRGEREATLDGAIARDWALRPLRGGDMPLAPSEASDWAVLGLTSSRQGTTCGEGVLRTKQVPHFVDLRSKGNSKPGGFFGGRARKPMGADADEVLRRPPSGSWLNYLINSLIDFPSNLIFDNPFSVKCSFLCTIL